MQMQNQMQRQESERPAEPITPPPELVTPPPEPGVPPGEPITPPGEPVTPPPEPVTPPSEPVTPPPEPVTQQVEPDVPATELLTDEMAPDGAAGTVPIPLEPDLTEKLAAAEEKQAEMQDAYLRAKAEAENFRRRMQEDIVRAHKFAIEGFADALVPVKDSLEAALTVETPSTDALKEGVEMTLKQLSEAFKKNRLTEINPMPGEKLDPMKHQAISMVASEQDANVIVSVLQKGYMIADRLLRPALVTVAQGKVCDNEV